MFKIYTSAKKSRICKFDILLQSQNQESCVVQKVELKKRKIYSYSFKGEREEHATKQFTNYTNLSHISGHSHIFGFYKNSRSFTNFQKHYMQTLFYERALGQYHCQIINK